MQSEVAASVPENSNLVRYTVQSSDVLSDMRINVTEEGSETVRWYKERFLAEEEIIDHVVENATSTIHWTIHRPKRGWYIRLRAPSFPPGTFVSLTPLPQTSPYHAEAALTFACRTNAPPSLAASSNAAASSSRSLDSDTTLTDAQRGEHSYPPTPPQNPAVRVLPPSPRSVHARLAEIRLSRPIPLVQITHFILTPHSMVHVPTTQPSIFSRMISVLKNSAPSHSSSFTLSPMPAVSASLPQAQTTPSAEAAPVPTPIPLLTYHDRTPVWTVGTTYGLIEIDKLRERELGVQTSFYVAVALTYLEFLTERESYIAATAD